MSTVMMDFCFIWVGEFCCKVVGHIYFFSTNFWMRVDTFIFKIVNADKYTEINIFSKVEVFFYFNRADPLKNIRERGGILNN